MSSRPSTLRRWRADGRFGSTAHVAAVLLLGFATWGCKSDLARELSSDDQNSSTNDPESDDDGPTADEDSLTADEDSLTADEDSLTADDVSSSDDDDTPSFDAGSTPEPDFPGTDLEPEPGVADPEAMPEAQPPVTSEPEPGSLPEPEPGSLPEPEPGSLPEPEPTSMAQPEPSVKVEPVPEPVVEPDPMNPDPSVPLEPEPADEPAPDGGAVAEVVQVISSVPRAGDTDVDPATDVVLEFSYAVELGSGTIAVVGAGDDAAIEEIPIADPRVTLSGSELRVDLDSILAGATAYYVTLSAGAVTRADGEDFAGIDDASTLSFSTAAITGPADVVGGLVLWLDAGYAESIKLDTGVRLWADRSGLQNDVSQTSAAGQPVLRSGGINGLPVVRFDGDDDVLFAAAAFPLSALEGFVVWQTSILPPTSVKAAVMRNDENFEINHGHWAPWPRYTISAHFETLAEWYESSFTEPEIDTPYLWNFTLDDVTQTLAARTQGGGASPMSEVGDRGTPGAEVSPPAPGSRFTVGNDEEGIAPLTGDVAELILYDRPLSQAERADVVAYMKTKWNTVLPTCSEGESDGVLDGLGNCFVLVTTDVSWDEARADCQGIGSGWDLASPGSSVSNGVVTGLLLERGVARAWLGGNDTSNEGDWVWAPDASSFWTGTSAATGGAPVSSAFYNWAPGQPSGGSTTNCASLGGTDTPGDGTWADDACSTELPYVCRGPG